MKIEIKNRFDGSVIFSHECENNTVKLTLEAAVKASANLRDANLRGANLRCANLCYADLWGANLCYADLRGANLCYAGLCYANLYNADLCYANLYDAELRDANLRYADLQDANLRGADLRRAIIAGGFICDGKFHRTTNVGSEGGILELYSCGDAGWYIKRGCFGGSKQEFLDAVTNTHGDNEHGKQYRAIVELFCGG